jgi:hypothetical protein
VASASRDLKASSPPLPAWAEQILDGVVLAALVFAPVAIVACFLAAFR